MRKTLIGPQLRQLRRLHNHTQAEMATRLGVSPAYVNLLENNQRSLSVKVLLGLTESYGIDLRSMVNTNEVTRLADLRSAVRDPVFDDPPPDLQELRAALDHAPQLVERFLALYQNHRTTLDNLRRINASGTLQGMVSASPETAIHDFFRHNSNHFAALEQAADAAREAIGGAPDDLYGNLKRHLRQAHGISVEVAGLDTLPDSLRVFDESAGQVRLSQALDQSNRNFQLAHVLALVSCGALLDEMIANAAIATEAGRSRAAVELANYFAAALLMPYDAFLGMAQDTGYDIDRIAAAFGVSFEQVCQRLTTLQRDSARGVPFFFLRIDRAGNVTKRFNATPFTLAEQGGSCPVWNIHSAFATPGTILTQFVELPDAGQFFTLSRTTERPVIGRNSPERRLAVTLGCEREHADRIGYARAAGPVGDADIARIGLNCHVCPRLACAQRAHEPLHVQLSLDAHRRGSNRYES